MIIKITGSGDQAVHHAQRNKLSAILIEMWLRLARKRVERALNVQALDDLLMRHRYKTSKKDPVKPCKNLA